MEGKEQDESRAMAEVAKGIRKRGKDLEIYNIKAILRNFAG